jgi:dolichol-phosphate mannosyltransferase
VYNEEASLLRFEEAVARVLLARPDYDFRVLFIDDGSSDRSWEMIRAACAREPRCRGVRLSRNFGPHIALSAGLADADADCVAILACDLQDPPEAVLQLLERWRAGAKVVWGKRRTRQDARWRVAAGAVFHGLLRRFAMPRGSKFTTGSFLLIDRQVVECVRRFREHNRITFALVAWTGFDQAVVEYDRAARVAGKSGWSLSRMVKSTYDAFVGFSHLPIRLMTLLGGAAFLAAVGLSIYLVLGWLTGNPRPGWTSIMLGVSFFFGIQFLLMGISGEYLYRIYTEVVRRPLYFVSERAGVAEGSCPAARPATPEPVPAVEHGNGR